MEAGSAAVCESYSIPESVFNVTATEQESRAAYEAQCREVLPPVSASEPNVATGFDPFAPDTPLEPEPKERAIQLTLFEETPANVSADTETPQEEEKDANYWASVMQDADTDSLPAQSIVESQLPPEEDFPTMAELAATFRRNGGLRSTFTIDMDAYNHLRGVVKGQEGKRWPSVDTMIFEAELPVTDVHLQGIRSRKPEAKISFHAKEAKLTRSITVRGVIWANDAGMTFVFGNEPSEAMQFGMDFSGDVEAAAEWQTVIETNRARNKRMGFTSPFPKSGVSVCPECGKEFRPTRKGQIYDTRNCASRVGERRRRAERNAKPAELN